MALIILDDEDQPALPDGPHFRVIVLLPEFVGKLIDKLVRFLVRRRVG